MAKGLWAGLDVGVETTRVCVIDAAGEVVHEASCPTALKSVHRELISLRRRKSARVGIEAATGMNLARGLRTLGYEVDVYEQRQLTKFLRVRRNKTDAGDALGIADAGRIGAGTVSKVYVKNLDCQWLQSQLTVRRHLIRQRVSVVNLLGRQIEQYGGRLKYPSLVRLRSCADAELRSIFGRRPNALEIELRHLLDLCEQMIQHQKDVDRQLTQAAMENDVCRRLMEIPGVGVICALTFYAAVGDPDRFRRSADVGAYFGLTPTVAQSGLTCRVGRISKLGHRAARAALVRAALAFFRWSKDESDLRCWALQIEQRCGRKKARVALARKLAVVMIAIWKSGQSYVPSFRGLPAASAEGRAELELDRCTERTERVSETENSSAISTNPTSPTSPSRSFEETGPSTSAGIMEQIEADPPIAAQASTVALPSDTQVHGPELRGGALGQDRSLVQDIQRQRG